MNKLSRSICSVSVLGLALLGQSQTQVPSTAKTFTLTVTVDKLRNTKGLLHVLLFGGEKGAKGFPGSDKDALRIQILPIAQLVSPANPRPTLTFTNLSPGVYALTLYHDENSNNKMDTFWYGKPREGAAASNNPRPFMRAPHYRESAFTLKDDTKITVQLWYP